MPLNGNDNPAPLATPFTAEQPTTLAQHRADRQHEADSKQLGEDFAKALNQGVIQGKVNRD